MIFEKELGKKVEGGVNWSFPKPGFLCLYGANHMFETKILEVGPELTYKTFVSEGFLSFFRMDSEIKKRQIGPVPPPMHHLTTIFLGRKQPQV